MSNPHIITDLTVMFSYAATSLSCTVCFLKSLLTDSIIYPLIWPMNHCKGLILDLNPVFKYATWILIVIFISFRNAVQNGLKFTDVIALFFLT